MKIELNDEATSAVWAIAFMIIFLGFSSCQKSIYENDIDPCAEKQPNKS